MTAGGTTVKGAAAFGGRLGGDTPQIVSPLVGMERDCGAFREAVPGAPPGCLVPGDAAHLASPLAGQPCGRGASAAGAGDADLAEGFAPAYEVSPGYPFLVGLHPTPCLLPLPSAPASPAALPSLATLNVRPHRAFLKQEENWLARDFYQERRWKMAASGRVGGLVAARARWMELRKKREERRLLASPVASAVQSLWLGAVSQVEPSLIPPALQPCCAALPPTTATPQLRLSLLRRRCRPSFVGAEASQGTGDGDTCSVASPRAAASSDAGAKAALLRGQVRNQAALMSPQIRGKLGSLFFVRDNPFSVYSEEDQAFLSSVCSGPRGRQARGGDAAERAGSAEVGAGAQREKEERTRAKPEEDKAREEAKEKKRSATDENGEDPTADGNDHVGSALPNGRTWRPNEAQEGEAEKEESRTQDCSGLPAETQDKTDEEDSSCASPRRSGLESTTREYTSRPSPRARRRKSATDDLSALDASDLFLPLSPSLHAFLLDTIARGLEDRRQAPFSRARREVRPSRRAPEDREEKDGRLPSFSPLFSAGASSFLLPCPREARGEGAGGQKKKEEKREEDTPLSSRELGLTAGVSEASPSAGSISTSREVDSPVHSVSTTWSSSLPVPSSSQSGLDGAPAVPASGASPVGRDSVGGRVSDKGDAEPAGRGAGTWGVPGACTCCVCRGEKTHASDRLPENVDARLPGAEASVSAHATGASPTPQVSGRLSLDGAADGDAERGLHCTCQLCFLSEGVLSKREYLASAPLLGTDDERHFVDSASLHTVRSPWFSARAQRGPDLFGVSEDGTCVPGYVGVGDCDLDLGSDSVCLSDWIYLHHEKTLDLAAPLTFDILANAPPSIFLGAAFSGFSDRAGPAALSRRTRDDRCAGAYSSRLKGASRGAGRFASHAQPPSPAHRGSALLDGSQDEPLADGATPGRDRKGDEGLKVEAESEALAGRRGASAGAAGAWPVSGALGSGAGDGGDGRDDRGRDLGMAGGARARGEEDEEDDELRPGPADGDAAQVGGEGGADSFRGAGEGPGGADAVALSRQKSRMARKDRRRKTAWKLLESVSLAAIWDILSKKTDNTPFTELLPVEFRPPDWRLDVCQIPALKTDREEWQEAVAELSNLADPFSPAYGSASSASYLPEFLFPSSPQGAPDRRGVFAYPDYVGSLCSPFPTTFGPEGFLVGAGSGRPHPTDGAAGADKENRDGLKDEREERRKDGRDDGAPSHLSPAPPGLYYPGAPGADRGRVADGSDPRSAEAGAEHSLGTYPYLHPSQAAAAYAHRQAGFKTDPALADRLFPSESGQRLPLFSSPYLSKAPFSGYPPAGSGRPGLPGGVPAAGAPAAPQGPGATAVSPRGRHPHLMLPGAPAGAHLKGQQGAAAGLSLARARDDFGAQRGIGVYTGGLSGGTLAAFARGRPGGERSHPQWDLNESAMLLALVKKFGQPNPHYIAIGSHKSRAALPVRGVEARKRQLQVVAGLTRLLQRRRLREEESSQERGSDGHKKGPKLSFWGKKGRLLSLLASVEREEREREARGAENAEKDGEGGGKGDASGGSVGQKDGNSPEKNGKEIPADPKSFPSVLTYSSRSVNWDLVSTTLSNSGTWLSNALAGSEGGRKQSSFSPQGISLVSIGDAMASSAVSRLRSPAECREQYLLLRAHLRKMVTQPRGQRHPMLVLLLQQYYKHVRRHPTFQENFYPFRPRQHLAGGRTVSLFSPGPPLFSHSVCESLASPAFAPLVDNQPPSAFFSAFVSSRLSPHLETSRRASSAADGEKRVSASEGQQDAAMPAVGAKRQAPAKTLEGQEENGERAHEKTVVVVEWGDEEEEGGVETGSVWTETGKRRPASRDTPFAVKRRRLEGETADDRLSVVFSVYPLGGSFIQDLVLWCSRVLDKRHVCVSTSRTVPKTSPVHRFLKVVRRRCRERRNGYDAYPRTGIYGLSRFLLQSLSPLLSLPSPADVPLSVGGEKGCGGEPRQATADSALPTEIKLGGFSDLNKYPLPLRLQLLLSLAASQLKTNTETSPSCQKGKEAADRESVDSLLRALLGPRKASGARSGEKASPADCTLAVARVGTVWGGNVAGAETVWEALADLNPLAYGLGLPDHLRTGDLGRHFGSFALRSLPLPSPAITANRAFFSAAFGTAPPAGRVKKRSRHTLVSPGTASEASALVTGPGSKETPVPGPCAPARDTVAGGQADGSREAEKAAEKTLAEREHLSAGREDGQDSCASKTKRRAEQEKEGEVGEKSLSFLASTAEKCGFWLMLNEREVDQEAESAQKASPAWKTSRSALGAAAAFGVEGPTFHEMIRCVTRKSLGALACSASHLFQPARFAGRSASTPRSASGARRLRACGAETVSGERARASFSSAGAAAGGQRSDAEKARLRGASLRDAWIPAEISQQEAEGIKLAASLVCRCSDSMRKRLAALNSLSDALGVRSLLPPGVPSNSLLVPPHPSQLRFLDGANHLLSSYVHRQEAPSLLYTSSASPRMSPADPVEAVSSRAKVPDPLSASNRLCLGVLPLTGPLYPHQFGAGLAPWLLIVNLALQREEQEQLLACATHWIQQSSRSSLAALPPNLGLATAGPAIVTPAVASLEAFRKPQLPEVLALYRSHQAGHRTSALYSRTTTEGPSSRHPPSSLAAHFAMARTGAGSLSAPPSGPSAAYSSFVSGSSLHSKQQASPPPRVLLSTPGGAPPQGPVPLGGNVVATPPSPGPGPSQDPKGAARLSMGREGDISAPAYYRPFSKDRHGPPTGPDAGAPPSPYFYTQCPSAPPPSYGPHVSYPGHGGGPPGAQPYPQSMPVSFQRPHEPSSEEKGTGGDPRARMLAPPAGMPGPGPSGSNSPQMGGMLQPAPGGRSAPAGKPEKTQESPSFQSSSAAPAGPYPSLPALPSGTAPGGFPSGAFHGGVPPGASGGESAAYPQGPRRDGSSFSASAGSEDRQAPFGSHGPAGSKPASGVAVRSREDGAPESGKPGSEALPAAGAAHAKPGADCGPPAFSGEGAAGPPHAGAGVFGTQRADTAGAVGNVSSLEAKGGVLPDGKSGGSGSDAAAVSLSPPYRGDEGASSVFSSAAGLPQKPNPFVPTAASGTPLHGPADAHSAAGAPAVGVSPPGPGGYPPRGAAPGNGRGPFPSSTPMHHAYSSMSGSYLQTPAGGSVVAGPYAQPGGPQLAGGAGRHPAGAGENPTFAFQVPRQDASGLRERESDTSAGAVSSTMHGCGPGQRPGAPAERRISGGKESDSGAGLVKGAKNLSPSSPGFYYPAPMGPEARSTGDPEGDRAGSTGQETGSQGPVGGDRSGARVDGEGHHNYGGPGGEFGYEAAQQSGGGAYRVPPATPQEYNPSLGPQYFSPSPHSSAVPQASPGVPGEAPASGAPAPHPGQGGPGAGPADPYPAGLASEATHGPAAYFGAPGGQSGGARSEDARRRYAGSSGLPGVSCVYPEGGGYGYPVPGRAPAAGKDEMVQDSNYMQYPVGTPNVPRAAGDEASLNRRDGQESPCPAGWGAGALPGGPYSTPSVSSLSSSLPSSAGSKQKRNPSAAAGAGAKAQPARKRQKKQPASAPGGEKGAAESATPNPSAASPAFNTPPGLKMGEERHGHEGGPDRAQVGVGGSPPKKEEADGATLNHHARGVQGAMAPSPYPSALSQGFENACGNPSMMGMTPGPFGGNQQLMPGVRPSDTSAGTPGAFLVQHSSPFLPHAQSASLTPHQDPNAPPPAQMMGLAATPGGAREMASSQEGVSPNMQASFAAASAYPGGMPSSMYGSMANTAAARADALQAPQPHRGPMSPIQGHGQTHMSHQTQPGRSMPAAFSAMGKPGIHGNFAPGSGTKPSALESGVAGPVPRNGDFGDTSRGASGAQHSHPSQGQQMTPHSSFVSGVAGPAMGGVPASGVAMAEGGHALSLPGGMHALGTSQSAPAFLPYSQNPSLSAPDASAQKPMNPQLQGSFSPALPSPFQSQMHASPQTPYVNSGSVPAPAGGGNRGPAFFSGGDRGNMQPQMHALPPGYFHNHPPNPYDVGHRPSGAGPPSGPMNPLSSYSPAVPMHSYGSPIPGAPGEGHSSYASAALPSHAMGREGNAPAGGAGLSQAGPNGGMGLPAAGASGGSCGVSNVVAPFQPGAYMPREGGLDRQNRGGPSQPPFAFSGHPGQRRDGREGEMAYSALPQSYYPAPAPGQFEEGA
ncbi:GH22120, related [Neospora caninum Liverpool]|uniref:GH22120, related n=1 Tax=Neospora caninum (strain Liverpool) TaxID=572307 RepID=F0VKF7_NEOCL|nr:GH22120, related [Neospora caninum Liverpool]CBZ54558.1 GH22120, related [Neospora caninum Liverpool]CEL69272.1 TPA: GH22120, related [Neospora caninum Liverpool]|eukprot:XP_003884588.1 GH22120, related [Neospora caninum Liverpool]